MQKQRQGYWLGDVVNTVGGWLDTATEAATKYAPLLKTGVAALSTYASWKDQQKKNQMQQDVYDDFMAQAQAAGHEAQAAVDLNLTPMTVSGTPTTKADVTDFTPVAKGGLMTLPNKQRKRYYAGTGEEEVIETDEEVLSPFDLQMEEGVNIGEQVKYNTGRPRHDAWNIWNSGGIDQDQYEFDFEIFFDSGDWSDMLKGQAPVQENMQMASDPSWEAEWDDIYENYKAKQISAGQEFVDKETFMMDYQDNMANGGIIGLRHGGRPGYADAGEVKDYYEGRGTPKERAEEIGGSYTNWKDFIYHGGAKLVEDLDWLKYDRDMSKEDAIKYYEQEWEDNIESGAYEPHQTSTFDGTPIKSKDQIREVIEEGWDMVEAPTTDTGIMRAAKGGRIGYADGTESGYTFEDFKKEKRQVDQFMGEEELKRLYEKLIREKKIAEEKTWAAHGGRIRKAPGGIMNLGGLEKDYRTTGGFVPIGGRERADDVPARLSKNEFVMTADAVRAAGGGSINKGAQRMYDTMKHLEASPQSKRMTA